MTQSLSEQYLKMPVPERYAGVTLDNYEPKDSHQRKALFRLQEEPSEVGRGYLLTGPPGTGKTRLASAYVNSRVAEGVEAGFTTLPQYNRLLLKRITLKDAWKHDPLAYGRWNRLDAALESLAKKVPVLALDDLGKEHTTSSGFMEDEIDYLVRSRFDRALTTVATTNVKPKDFATKYSPSMYSFIHECFDIILMNGDDYRQVQA